MRVKFDFELLLKRVACGGLLPPTTTGFRIFINCTIISEIKGRQAGRQAAIAALLCLQHSLWMYWKPCSIISYHDIWQLSFIYPFLSSILIFDLAERYIFFLFKCIREKAGIGDEFSRFFFATKCQIEF